MTLRHRFKQWLDTDPRYQIRDVQLEIIAEDFAIGFAEWYLDLWNRNDKSFDNNSPKELLQIYKKQQQL